MNNKPNTNELNTVEYHKFPWNASFIWGNKPIRNGLTVHHFRYAFDLDDPHDLTEIFVSADSRYRLFVNGIQIGRGPIKGTLNHYHVERYELEGVLRKAKNVFAAEVWWFGENAPISEVHSDEPGLLVYSPHFNSINTSTSWKTRGDRSIIPDTNTYGTNAQQFLNHTERADRKQQDGLDWTTPEYDDSSWENAVVSGSPTNKLSKWGVSDKRELYIHNLPQQTEEPERFIATIRDHSNIDNLFGEHPKPLPIASNQGATFTLQAEALTTAYPILKTAGGEAREIRISYSEALGFWKDSNGKQTWEKDQRDDLNGEVHGYRDTVILSGREESYQPFHWRTFRFVKIEVLPGKQPCEILDCYYLRTTFPQTLKASFESSDSDSTSMWDTSWRTLQLCAHETYEDCPYYEQQNYIADTRIQALGSYYLANDTRLARHCLELYRSSIRPDGLVGSRVPSCKPQIIPYFSFHWIFMLEDYWNWTGERDLEFTRSCLWIVDSILVYFRERLNSHGYFTQIPPWNMIDASSHWTRGEPPAVIDGESTLLTCIYIQALESAIRLHTQAGAQSDANRWIDLPEKLRKQVQKSAWNEEQGLFLEGPNRFQDPLSQHTQVAAVLADVPNEAQKRKIACNLFKHQGIIETSSMQSFYMARALTKLGIYSKLYSNALENWRFMLRKGTTTWWEYPQNTRSDCHAWSSWIAIEFLHTTLGIGPGSPGWRSISISPNTAALDWAKGSSQTPAGTVSVEWKKRADRLYIKIETPPAVPTVLTLPGQEESHTFAGGSFETEIYIRLA